MQPPSTPPYNPNASELSQIPDSGIPSKPLTADQLLTEMTPEQRKLLKIFLKSSNPFALRYIYGNQIDWISYRLEELIGTYKSNSQAVRDVLLILLDDFPDSDEGANQEKGSLFDSTLSEDPQAQAGFRSAVKQVLQPASEQEGVSPFADTVLSSIPPAPVSEPPSKAEVVSPWASEASPDENRTLISKPQTSSNNEENNAVAEAVQDVVPKGIPVMTDTPWADTEASKDDINVYVARLTDEKKDALPDYLQVNRNNPNQVKAYAGKYGVCGLELDYEMAQMAERLGCSIDELRTAASIVLKGGHVVTDNIRKKKVLINSAIDPRQQPTVISARKKSGEVSSPPVPKKSLLARLFGRKNA